MEAVALVGANGDKACTHGEAMKVTGDIAVHIGKLVSVKVVTCREVECPVLGRTYVA